MSDWKSVSLCSVVCGTLWFVVAVVIVAAWVLTFTDHEPAGRMLGFSGCALSAVAAVLSVRGYAVRMATLIRVCAGIQSRGADVHSLR